MIGTQLQLPICETIAQYIDETGDHKVSYLQLPDRDDMNVGSRDHPGEIAHRQAAGALVKYLKTFLGGI
jgi:hypothetical protein